MIRRFFFAFLAVIPAGTMAVFAGDARAWGPYGHAIVAEIAGTRLTPQAAYNVARLLAQESSQTLDQVASWPDTIGHVPPAMGGLPQTLPWHYVDIDTVFPAYEKARDCANALCVTEKLPEMEKILANPKAKPADRLSALKWVVHLMGDLHQPLHAAEHDHDKGGNLVSVSYFGQDREGRENLHSLWDEGILDRARRLVVGPHYSIDLARSRAEADRMNSEITPGQAVFWSGDLSPATLPDLVRQWTDESHRIARSFVYEMLPVGQKKNLGSTYTSLAFPVIETRLQQAGVRLAAVLNMALASP